jgi:hypothetical protein
MGIAVEYLITAVFGFVPETCGVVLEHEERVWSVLLHGCFIVCFDCLSMLCGLLVQLSVFMWFWARTGCEAVLGGREEEVCGAGAGKGDWGGAEGAD